ncbi:ABC transporter ATP-binding protein [Propionicimonas sp.]|uniref:ABC transporter ATP-binding protein n=1 Tax=Propionicimonas sp. TaxID=1955623 RepID=UPI0017AA1E17|nr:ABC transporter ATP-binding protein [Propionicimonas sp.]MBU3977890.1 ABC transporter ATP-binding protein [Actinomycetota bacterium]MBA3021887.1 ABC transporter ATP-binding protein [Propionicimonas sp.]MBU3985334.1 ABC transporter ATP-binding protein [Actinomycetota bacterium]MBU4007389.1 ABC transporter ATP-binding protein [Actinomycetota bacterium]MBU4065665.1 ABC transporter ATP-binding protein [Actinomycetota bacterium]
MTTDLLTIDGLGVEIGGLPVLSEVTLSLPSHGVLGLVGETGSGKSLTCRALMGLLPRIGGKVVAGSIGFDGTTLTDLDDRGWSRVRGGQIGFVPQASLNALDPVMTVGAQLRESVRHLDPGAEVMARSRELLELVRLPNPQGVLRRYPHELSGGMRQRVMIALALAGRPRLLVADEPTTALDVTVQKAILEVFADLRAASGMSLLLVTHDLGVVADVADTIAVMYGGTVVEVGNTGKVMREPAHPYTAALLGARPTSRAQGERLVTIPGVPAVPGQWPTGCRFAPRCPHARDVCRTEQPALLPLTGDRSSACHGWPGQSEEASTNV